MTIARSFKQYIIGQGSVTTEIFRLFHEFCCDTISFISWVLSFLLGARRWSMGTQGRQSPNLIEFMLACVVNTVIAICVPANSICECQLKHFPESIRDTFKKVVIRISKSY